MVHYYTEVTSKSYYAFMQFISGYLTWVMFYYSREHSSCSNGALYGNFPEDSIELLGKGIGYEIEDMTHEILKARETLVDKSDAKGRGVLLLLHPHFKAREEDPDFYTLFRSGADLCVRRFMKEESYGLFIMENNANDMKFPVYLVSANFRLPRTFFEINAILPKGIEDREHNRYLEENTPEKIREEIQLIFKLASEDLKLIAKNNYNNNNDNDNDNNDPKKSQKCFLM